MDRDSRELNSRVIALCCSRWGISPAEFRRLSEAGELHANDMLATLELAVIESPVTFLAQKPILLEWLFPEPEESRVNKRQNRLQAEFSVIEQLYQKQEASKFKAQPAPVAEAEQEQPKKKGKIIKRKGR